MSVENIKVKSSTSEEGHWSRQQVLSLINSVETYFEDFYDDGKRKKVIWEAVAQRMKGFGYNLTGLECDRKWRNLKSTYIKVLQKHIHGDYSYRFEYFDALHPILGKEIDPLGMSEQTVPQSSQLLPTAELSGGNSEYQEINVDDGFVWVHSAINLMLDRIRQSFSDIGSPETTQEKWEAIAEYMQNESYSISTGQCQRKWENLQDGYYYYQRKSQGMNADPSWPYYQFVKDVMISLNIPVAVQVEPKVCFRTVDGKGMKMQYSKRFISKKRFADNSYRKTPSQSLLSCVQQLETDVTIDSRLERLEEQMENAQAQQNIYSQTNNLLSAIVAELRKVNQKLESENYHRAMSHNDHHRNMQRPVSPNAGIIIVEDIAGQLQ